CGEINRKSDSTLCQFNGSIPEHYSPDTVPFQLRNPPRFSSKFGYSGLADIAAFNLDVPVGQGKPSAILGSAAVVRNRVIAAKASMSRFTVVLLCERIRTVIHCRRQRGFLHSV